MPSTDPIVVRLDQIRRHRGWSMRHLARLSGVSAATISEAVSGHHSPTLDATRRMADALGVRLEVDARPYVRTDPAVRFGLPAVRGIAVDVLAGAVWAGDPVDQIAAGYGLSRGDVLVACAHAGMYGTGNGAADTRRWRDRWRVWAQPVWQAMWDPATCDYAALPDPPTRDG